MGRQINRLSARGVTTMIKSGYHADGGGLYLQVSRTQTRSWLFCFTLRGRSREMGLGELALVPLAEARQRALDCRRMLRDGIDPIDARRLERKAALLAEARTVTLQDCALAYIEAHRAGWRNAKHAEQWRSTLQTYVFPTLGVLPVQDVDTALIMRVVEPIWQTKTETASRVRGRLEAILDWATVRRYRQGDNPARWRGHLDHLLPRRAKVQMVVHHPALQFDLMGAFMTSLVQKGGVAAYGLAFQILTAARTGEVIGARWDEIDETKRLWTIPGCRMKAGREHRVALSSAVIRLLGTMRRLRQSEHVFPGQRVGMPLSNMAFLTLLRRMGRADLTAHGFRSSFRDWAAERTEHPRDLIEMALAHSIGDKVEAAYRRGDMFEKRCRLMEDWARHCGMSSDATLASEAGRAGMAA